MMSVTGHQDGDQDDNEEEVDTFDVIHSSNVLLGNSRIIHRRVVSLRWHFFGSPDPF